MAFTEDLAGYFKTADFGTSATWSVGSATVVGIFDSEYARELGMIDATDPQFVCRESDMSSAAQGQTLTINAVSYTIVGVEPDGTGLLTLRLRKSS